MKKLFNYLIQSIFIYLFFLIGIVLQLNLSRKLYASLFCLLGPALKSKKIIDKNLNIFSQNINVLNKKKIIKNMWRNYGMTFIEYIFLEQICKKDNNIILKGKENLLHIKENNKPVIFVSGHFANFELMSMEITKHGVPLATIYRPLNNIFLNPLMEYLRKKNICKNQIKKGIKGVREAIEFINKKHCIALMIDQRVSEGEKISLFGKEALTTTLPAQLSIKYNLDIVPVYIKRLENNNFEIEFKNRINPSDFHNKLDLTKKLNKVLEGMIKINPDQWIWTHNRWK